MTARYKLRTQLSENERGLAHVTVQLEKHMFIDRTKLEILQRVGDGVEGVEELLLATKGILKALGPEVPETAMLGLETEWQTLSEKGAEELMSKFYQAAPTFTVTLQGGARDGSMLIVAGNASMSVPLAKDQAQRDKEQLERLRQYCEDHPPQHMNDVERAKEAMTDVGVVTGATYKAGVACLEGAVAGAAAGRGPVGEAVKAAIGCIAGIASALGAFLGLVEHAEKQMREEQDARDRERACESEGGDYDGDMVDRVNRTC